MVVSISSLFFLILGWDGLGLVSFFLIVYYQNQVSITSGLFTLLINRIGDCFFLVSLGLIYLYGLNSFSLHTPYVNQLILSVCLLVTFITKRALYPFSSWLPLAIAAPTPISALVHSSTLVTAGLYLIMRYRFFLIQFPCLIKVMVVVRIFTSFYAGFNSVFETDLKKLIALSTLSHLGFIGLSFFCGFVHLAFFHLLTHALFKRLLFMTIGDIMTNLNHSQDIRFLSLGVIQTPGSCFIMYISLFNLLGLPSIRGFFSKDLVLERFHYSDSRLILLLILFLNVIFTYFYTYQLFFYSMQRRKTLPYSIVHFPERRMHPPLLLILGLLSLYFSKVFIALLLPSLLFVPVPLTFKLLPLILNSTIFFSLLLKKSLPKRFSPFLWFYFSKIAGLSLVSMPVSSFVYYFFSFKAVRRIEQGLIVNSFNSHLLLTLSSISLRFYSLIARTPLKSVLIVRASTFVLITLML